MSAPIRQDIDWSVVAERYEAGESMVALARDLGVSPSTVNLRLKGRVTVRRSWRLERVAPQLAPEGHGLVPVMSRRCVVAWALVDVGDLEATSQYRWNPTDGYAVGFEYLAGGRHRSIRMHRLIVGLARGDSREVDHVNGNRLDNRRENLRIVTSAQNSHNMRAQVGAFSGYRGVSFDRRQGVWCADVQMDGKRYRLGRFETELSAARAAARFRATHMSHAVEDPALLEGAA